jgi:hypothetical protein
MTISLLSRKMAGVHKGLIALALGAATINCMGCALPGNLSLTGAASVNTATNGTQQPGPIQTVSAVDVAPVKDSRADTHMKEAATKFPAAAPLGKPTALCTYWDRDLQSAPDPTHHGERVPCLVGRMVMLQGEKDVCCDGKLRVILFDDLPADGGAPVKLEQWDINANNLRKMLTKDPALRMWGYTLAMPTATCENRTGKIHIDVEFTPVGGETQYASSGSFKLKSIASSFHQGVVTPASNHPAQATQAAAQPPEPQLMPQIQYQR